MTYRTVDEVMATPNEWTGALRVHGEVVEGSVIERGGGEPEVRFTIASNGKQLEVRHAGPLPEAFREGATVIAEGRLGGGEGAYYLDATGVIVR